MNSPGDACGSGCGACGVPIGLPMRTLAILALAGVIALVDLQVRPFQAGIGGAGVVLPAGGAAPTADPASGPSPGAPVAGVSGPETEAPDGRTTLSLEQALALYNEGLAQFVDARAPDEFAAGRIPGAVRMSPEDFASGQVPEAVLSGALRRDSNVVVYCGGGACDASKLVARRLTELGYQNVAVFLGGWGAWSSAGLAAEEGAP
ncbi:MAG: hypothetical protein C0475_05185 [Planctomyces sp.]|nr:hypothetical protein [Planctomyces sp.]MBA4038824.1 hypothetical protein [Planctomyces sp.]